MAAHDEAVAEVTEQLAFGKQLVPHHLWGGILNHVLDGRGTGNFIARMIENDLLNAITAADDTTLARIRDIMVFMHNYAPQRCWGSPERARRWREAGGIRGGAHELGELDRV